METKATASGAQGRGLYGNAQRRFLVMIACAIVISMLLVSVAMGLYNSSGAAQLDLSRPEYKAVRKDVMQDNNTETYPATGDIDQAAIDQFNTMYSARAKSVSSPNSFDPNAMSDDALQLFSSQVANP